MRKSFGRIKITTARVEHLCDACSKPIPRGVKALVNYYGYSQIGGFFSCYFHLDKKNACHLDFMEVTGILPESEDGLMIVGGRLNERGSC